MISRITSFSLLLVIFVLVPFLLWEDNVSDLFETLFSQSYASVLVGAIIIISLSLDCILPTPSSLVSATAALYFGFYAGALIIFTGMTLGVSIGYMVGAQLIRIPHISQILKEKDVKKLDHWTDRYGLLSLSLTRPIPVLAEVSVMLAGASNVSFSRLAMYTIPANVVVALAYSSMSLM